MRGLKPAHAEERLALPRGHRRGEFPLRAQGRPGHRKRIPACCDAGPCLHGGVACAVPCNRSTSARMRPGSGPAAPPEAMDRRMTAGPPTPAQRAVMRGRPDPGFPELRATRRERRHEIQLSQMRRGGARGVLGHRAGNRARAAGPGGPWADPGATGRNATSVTRPEQEHDTACRRSFRQQRPSVDRQSGAPAPDAGHDTAGLPVATAAGTRFLRPGCLDRVVGSSILCPVFPGWTAGAGSGRHP